MGVILINKAKKYSMRELTKKDGTFDFDKYDSQWSTVWPSDDDEDFLKETGLTYDEWWTNFNKSMHQYDTEKRLEDLIEYSKELEEQIADLQQKLIPFWKKLLKKFIG